MERLWRLPSKTCVGNNFFRKIYGINLDDCCILKNSEQNSPAPPAARLWKPGDQVMALLEGGGYAEYAAVQPGNLMDRVFHDARDACVPEVFLTAFQLLSHRNVNLQPGDAVLLRAGASAVALAAAQLAIGVFRAGTVVALTRSESKFPSVLHNMERAAKAAQLEDQNYRVDCKVMTETQFLGLGEDTTEQAGDVPPPIKANCILDPVVGENFMKFLRSHCERDARVVVFAGMAGYKVPDFDLGPVMMRGIRIFTSTLRARASNYKTDLVAEFSERALPLLKSGAIEVNLDSVFKLDEVIAATEKMERNENAGKIVLEI